MVKETLYNILEGNTVLFFRNSLYISKELLEMVIVINYNNNIYTDTLYIKKFKSGFRYIQLLGMIQETTPVRTKHIDKIFELDYISNYKIEEGDDTHFKSIIRKGKLKTLLC